MNKEQLLNIHIYVPDKINETLLVYFDLGFKIMILLNGDLSILYKSFTDYDWPFNDRCEIVPQFILNNLKYTELASYFAMCSRSELISLIEYNTLCQI